MSALATRIEKEAGRPLTPLEIFDITAAHESSLSRLLMLYISTGLVFMLLPGTFLGVWNLMAISSRRSADSVSPAWIQAHGHAQIFGWIGTFILGIGFYSIPKIAQDEVVCAIDSVVVLGAMDLRCHAALADQRLPVALASASSALGDTRSGCVCDFLSHRFWPPSSRLRQGKAGRMGVGGDHWIGGSAAHTAHQLRSYLVSRFAGHVPRTAAGFRPALPRAPDLGIPRRVRLGIQREVASGISGIAAYSRSCFVVGRRTKFHGSPDSTWRLDGNGSVPPVRGDSHRRVCAQTLRVASASSQNQGCARELPGFCEIGVWVGANCRIPRHLGLLGRQLAWNLGSFPSRAYRWLLGDDGICGGSASAPGIFRNAIALQHQAYVSRDADSDGRMPAARQF